MNFKNVNHSLMILTTKIDGCILLTAVPVDMDAPVVSIGEEVIPADGATYVPL